MAALLKLLQIYRTKHGGDMEGMGADLFGSSGEATWAALVLVTTSPDLKDL